MLSNGNETVNEMGMVNWKWILQQLEKVWMIGWEKNWKYTVVNMGMYT